MGNFPIVASTRKYAFKGFPISTELGHHNQPPLNKIAGKRQLMRGKKSTTKQEGERERNRGNKQENINQQDVSKRKANPNESRTRHEDPNSCKKNETKSTGWKTCLR